MVGVPGKSRGCNVCRQRKIKCDRQRPPCGQCIKSNRICTGYQRDRHFKNLSAFDRGSLLARAQPLVPITKPSVITYESPTSDSINSLEKVEDLNIVSEALTANGSIKLSGLFFCFLDQYVPKETAGEGDSPASWLQVIPRMQGNNRSLELAATALSLVVLGRKNGNMKVVNEGLDNYGKALEGLQQMLSSPDRMYEEHTLASCMAMSLFEVLEASGENIDGWSSHVEGISRLFQLRGPESHVANSSHRLFLGFRPTAIIRALTMRRPTFIGEARWVTVPWKKLPKNDFHLLLDIIAQIPKISAQTDSITRALDTEAGYSTKILLLKQNWNCHHQLQEWYRQFSDKSHQAMYFERNAASIAARLGRKLEPLFPSSLEFINFEFARIHLFYWAALLITYDNIQTICCSILDNHFINHQSTRADFYRQLKLNSFSAVSEPTFLASSNLGSQNTFVEDFIRVKTYETAKLIVESMEYLLSKERNVVGPQNVFFPLKIAMHGFANESGPEVVWCKKVLDELDERGYPFAKVLRDTHRDDIPALLSGTRPL